MTKYTYIELHHIQQTITEQLIVNWLDWVSMKLLQSLISKNQVIVKHVQGAAQ